jgi:glycosyltransferase involved in cell wall biosynthesis
MKIAFDAQPLLDGQKTGVGFCESGILGAMLYKANQNSYSLNYFASGQQNMKQDYLNIFSDKGAFLQPCTWFPGKLYRILWNFIPVPYSLFFGKQYDVTHFFNFHVPPGVHGLVVTTVHDMAYKVFPETVRLKTKLMLNLSLHRSLRRAHKVMVVSKFTKNELIKYFSIPAEKIFVAYNGVNTEIFYPRTNIVQIRDVKLRYGIEGDFLLYMGTLEPRKNIVRLIEAYAYTKTRMPDLPALVLAGRKGWLYDEIFEKIIALKLERNIIFTGYVADKDAPFLLSGATAFLFPSLYEGFGMPPLEAMACGTPVLSSNTSALPEVVGDAGILVDPYDIDAIANGIRCLSEDKQLRGLLSDRGLERVKQFTWERSADIIMDVYNELTGESDE